MCAEDSVEKCCNNITNSIAFFGGGTGKGSQSDGPPDRWTEVRTDGRTDRQAGRQARQADKKHTKPLDMYREGDKGTAADQG